MTNIFIVVVVAMVVIFDIWIIWKRGKPASISATIIRGSKKFPLITLAVGMLLGHLYWSMQTQDVYGNIECKEIQNRP